MSAADPTDASGDAESTVNVIVLLVTPAEMVDNAGILLGDVGLPPQLSSNAPTVTNEMACAQNSRRDGVRVSMREAMCNAYAVQQCQ